MQLRRVTGELAKQETTRGEIEFHVRLFAEESNSYKVPVDEDGFFNQTLASIAQRGLEGKGGDLWLALDNGSVAAFALTHLSTDVDNKPCFWITCAYIAKPYRGTGYFSDCYAKLEQEAVRVGAAHIVLPSSRNNEAYIRKLPGYHPYVVLLKKDL